jgi:hypothetical protein
MSAGDAVATVDDDLHRARQTDVTGDACEVGAPDIGAARLAAAVLQFAGVHSPADPLNRLAGEGLAADDHFQAVVIGRVVAAGDGDAAVTAQFVSGEVDDRCRHAADVNGVDPGHADSFHQCRRQFRSRQAPVAADGNRALAAFARQRAESMADASDDVGRQCLADDAANVVGLEDFRGEGSVHVRPRAESNEGCVAAATRAAPAGCR